MKRLCDACGKEVGQNPHFEGAGKYKRARCEECHNARYAQMLFRRITDAFSGARHLTTLEEDRNFFKSDLRALKEKSPKLWEQAEAKYQQKLAQLGAVIPVDDARAIYDKLREQEGFDEMMTGLAKR
jgi:hypothetical protein